MAEAVLTTDRNLRATIDHVVARSVGGEDVKENTVAACAACNVAKASMSAEEYRLHPVRLERLRAANTLPDRLSVDQSSPYHDTDALARGVGVRFRGQERDDVEEYCRSEGWVRVPAGKALGRRGRPVTVKLRGHVEPYYYDLGSEGT
jgi:hypothetical protein